MAISIKKLTLNTTVNKQTKEEGTAPEGAGGGGMTKMDKEAIIQECLSKVQELIDYQLRP